MSTKGYTILGWIVWRIARRVAKRKLVQKRAKLGAAGVVGLVAAAGVLAARSGDD